MKFLKLYFLVFFIGSFLLNANAQDTLPNFSVQDLGKDKVLISWNNPFPNCVQIAVQRSFDSTRFFTTIYSAQSPNLPQNGFADIKMPAGLKPFYRIFYVLEGGKYFFSKSKTVSPYIKSAAINNPSNNLPKKTTDSREIDNRTVITPTEKEPTKEPIKQPEKKVEKQAEEKYFINIYKRTKDTLYAQIESKLYKQFRDSIIQKTKDTIYTLAANEILLKPFIPKPIWKPSTYLFTNNADEISIKLGNTKLNKYSIKFFEEDGTELFTIKHVKESELILDKTNFLHAGWFVFELYENDKLKERNKFYVPKLF